MQCYLYGHADVEPASGLKGNCYSLSGAEVIEPVEVSEVKIRKGLIRLALTDQKVFLKTIRIRLLSLNPNCLFSI